MAETVVKIENLSKKYNSKSEYAIENLSFEFFEGEVVGILGHNGAGKSTTLKCLTGMLPFDKGEIEICGNSIKTEPVAAKLNFGFVSDNHAVFEKMTGREYLNFMADIYGVDVNIRDERINNFQKIFNLGNSINYLINSYSHGMKQKICLMGSLIHQPKLWILDEPLTGLDAKVSNALKNYIQSYSDLQKTVIFSTHNLDVVEKICTRAIIISNGKLVYDLNMKEFKKTSKISFEDFALSNIGG